MKRFAVGIDIGGTNTVLGFVDNNGNISHEISFKTKDYITANGLLVEVARHIKNTLEENPDMELIGIGVGAPNGNYFTGSIDFAPNLRWEGVIPVVELIQKHINTVAILTNDANAAAIGEKIFGDAKDCDNFVVVTLGTGLGSGYYIQGNLLYGHTGSAGELGHTIAIPNGRDCGCGRKGCLETYASASGIVRTVAELLASKNSESQLREYRFNEIDAELIFKAAKDNDPIALEAFDVTAKILAKSLADSTAITSPERIYLFGGLAKSGDLLMKPLKKHYSEAVLSIFKNTTEIRLSALMTKNAAILGSASLVWDKINKK